MSQAITPKISINRKKSIATDTNIRKYRRKTKYNNVMKET